MRLILRNKISHLKRLMNLSLFKILIWSYR